MRQYNQHPEYALAILDFIEGSAQRAEILGCLGLELTYNVIEPTVTGLENYIVDFTHEGVQAVVNRALWALGGIHMTIESSTGVCIASPTITEWIPPNSLTPNGHHNWVCLDQGGLAVKIIPTVGLRDDLEAEITQMQVAGNIQI